MHSKDPTHPRYATTVIPGWHLLEKCLPAALVLAMLLAGGCASQITEKPATPAETTVQPQPPPPPARADIPGPAEGMLSQAGTLVAKNRVDAAKTIYQRIIREYGQTPQANEARFRLGEILLLQNEIDKAYALLTEAGSKLDKPFAWESLSLLGDIQASRGEIQRAWASWIKVAYSPSSQASTSWQRLLTSYIQNGNPSNTKQLLSLLPPGQLPNERASPVLATAEQLETGKLLQLYTIQPPGSPLTPLFALILGDRQLKEGGTQEAQRYWQAARANDLTAQEVLRRLTPPDSQPGLSVGLLLPLSGNYEKLGKSLLRTANKALHDYPDTKIVLRVADSRGKAEDAKNAMEQFRTDGINAVIGPVFHEEAKAAAEVATRYNLPILTLNPRSGIGQAGPSVFQNAFRPENEAQFMATFAMKEKNFKRIAILAPDTEYGHLLAQTFTDIVRQSGGDIVRVAFFPTGSRDFSPWIKALVNADPKNSQPRPKDARQNEPNGKDPYPKSAADFEALFLPANAQEVRLIAPQAAFFGLRQPEVMLLGTSLWNKPELLKEGTDFIKGAYFCDTDDVARNLFNASYYQTWKDSPSPLDMLTYDSIAMIAQSLRVERTSGKPWHLVLKGGQQIYGAAGVVYFDENRQSRRNHYLYRIETNGPKKIDPMPWQGHIAKTDSQPIFFQPTETPKTSPAIQGQTIGNPIAQPKTAPPNSQPGPTFF